MVNWILSLLKKDDGLVRFPISKFKNPPIGYKGYKYKIHLPYGDMYAKSKSEAMNIAIINHQESADEKLALVNERIGL